MNIKVINRVLMLISLLPLLFSISSCSLSSNSETSKITPENNRGDAFSAWEATKVYAGSSKVVHELHIWEAKWWNQGKEPGGASDTANVWTDLGLSGGTVTEPEILLLHDADGELKVTIYMDEDNPTTYSGRIILENPNTEYVWNESYFTIWDVEFETSSLITEIRSTNGAVNCTQDGGITTIDLGWQSLIGFDKLLNLFIQLQNLEFKNSQLTSKSTMLGGIRMRCIQNMPAYQALLLKEVALIHLII